MFYRIDWDKVGLPDGFFVVRFDLSTESWQVINSSGVAQSLLANFLALSPAQRHVRAYKIPATGAIHYSIDDVVATSVGTTHYQIIQSLNGYLSIVEETDPDWASTTLSLPENTVADQRIFIETCYFQDPTAYQVLFHDHGDDLNPPVDTAEGSLEGIGWPPGKSYWDDGLNVHPDFHRTTFLEIKGFTEVEFDGDLMVADISVPNVLIWT